MTVLLPSSVSSPKCSAPPTVLFIYLVKHISIPPLASSDIASTKSEVLSSRDLSQLLLTLTLDLGHLPRDPGRKQALAALLTPRVPELQGGLLVDALDLLSRCAGAAVRVWAVGSWLLSRYARAAVATPAFKALQARSGVWRRGLLISA